MMLVVGVHIHEIFDMWWPWRVRERVSAIGLVFVCKAFSGISKRVLTIHRASLKAWHVIHVSVVFWDQDLSIRVNLQKKQCCGFCDLMWWFLKIRVQYLT